jgi:hypothetical protein
VPFDLLRTGASTIPIEVFKTNAIGPLVNVGDEIIGSAAVDCPSCSQGHTYVFEILYGQEGWFAEDDMLRGEGFRFPKNLADIPKLKTFIDATPATRRIPFENYDAR